MDETPMMVPSCSVHKWPLSKSAAHYREDCVGAMIVGPARIVESWFCSNCRDVVVARDREKDRAECLARRARRSEQRARFLTTVRRWFSGSTETHSI